MWLCSLCTCVSLLASPVTVAVCRRKSTRLTAVIGGLVAALGCLFSSFASQHHQLFLSMGLMLGVYRVVQLKLTPEILIIALLSADLKGHCPLVSTG